MDALVWSEWRRLPLGSSAGGDEFAESGVEWFPGLGVDAVVGSAEHEPAVSGVGDGPAVLVEEPVVVSTQQDQIVEVGGASVASGDTSPNGPWGRKRVASLPGGGNGWGAPGTQTIAGLPRSSRILFAK